MTWRWLVIAAACVACGRSTLEISEGTGGAGGQGASSSSTTSATTGSGGTVATSSCDALELDAGPTVVLENANQDAVTPSVAVIDAGDRESGRPARLAVQAVISGGNLPTLQLSSVRAGEGAIAVEQGPTAHASSFTWSPLVRETDGEPAVALLYNDSAALKLGLFDTSSWQRLSDHAIPWSASSPIGIAAGAGLGDAGVGYAGRGFGLLYQRVRNNAVDIMFVVVSPDGASWLELKTVIEGLASDDVYASVAWSGSHYLVTNSRQSAAVENGGMDVWRYLPATGDLIDDSELEHVWGIDPSSDISWRHPYLVSGDDEVWLGVEYFDQYDDEDGVVVQRLASDGERLAEGAETRLYAPTRMVALGDRLVVAGNSFPRVSVGLFDESLSELGELVHTQHELYNWGPNAMVAIDRGVAFVTSADQGGHKAIFLTTLRCID